MISADKRLQVASYFSSLWQSCLRHSVTQYVLALRKDDSEFPLFSFRSTRCQSVWLFPPSSVPSSRSTIPAPYTASSIILSSTNSQLKEDNLLSSSLEIFLRPPGTFCVLETYKVASLVSDSVLEIVRGLNPSGHTMVLGSTQTLTEISTGDLALG
jgi:hypothetical protein